MNKLEIKHLAPYLPYGLKMKFDAKGGRIITLTGITDQSEYDANAIITGGDGSLWLNGSGFKPILRPLSDLSKEIEHNGEKFVPIVDLAKIQELDKIEYVKITSKNRLHYIDYESYWENNDGLKHKSRFCFCENTMSFQTGDVDVEMHKVTKFQIQLWQKLFEWHFDIFYLIDKKLAIDINEVKL